MFLCSILLFLVLAESELNSAARCLVFFCLYSPPDPHQDACSCILSESNRRSFALISALPSSGIRQIRIHWLLNTVTLHSQLVLKALTAVMNSVNSLSMICFRTSVWTMKFLLFPVDTENQFLYDSLQLVLFIDKQKIYCKSFFSSCYWLWCLTVINSSVIWGFLSTSETCSGLLLLRCTTAGVMMLLGRL